MSTGPQFPQSPGAWAIWVIGVIAIIGIVYVMLSVSGIAVPWWVITIGWILLAAILAVAAIRVVMWMTRT